MDINISDVDRRLLDTVGPWTKRKHDIVAYYAQVYSSILTNSQNRVRLTHFYIDGFASSGLAIDKATDEIIFGSALRVRRITPPFNRYFFVELNSSRAKLLQRLCSGDHQIEVIPGDANDILPRVVLPQVRYSEGERALLFLDPYKIGPLHWDTVVAASLTHAVDVLLHFPIMDINRSVLRKDRNIREEDALRLSRFWGDDSWREAAYTKEGLLQLDGVVNKSSHETMVGAYCSRLRKVAGFKHVVGSILLQNKRNAPIYYLIIASHNDVAGRVMQQVNRKFGTQAAGHRSRAPRHQQLDFGI